MELTCKKKSNDNLWCRGLDDISVVVEVSADLTDKVPLGHENPPNVQNNFSGGLFSTVFRSAGIRHKIWQYVRNRGRPRLPNCEGGLRGPSVYLSRWMGYYQNRV